MYSLLSNSLHIWTWKCNIQEQLGTRSDRRDSFVGQGALHVEHLLCSSLNTILRLIRTMLNLNIDFKQYRILLTRLYPSSFTKLKLLRWFIHDLIWFWHSLKPQCTLPVGQVILIVFHCQMDTLKVSCSARISKSIFIARNGVADSEIDSMTKSCRKTSGKYEFIALCLSSTWKSSFNF